jgi:hypothetical protein
MKSVVLSRAELGAQNFSELSITEKAVSVRIPGIYGRITQSNNYLEKKFRAATPTRNFITLNKLIEMSK